MSWQLIGFAGTALFTSRWLVQTYYARRAGSSVVTPAFWILSLCGNLLLVIYFGLGRQPDPVGVLGNVVPLGTALYNLKLICMSRGKRPIHLPARGVGERQS